MQFESTLGHLSKATHMHMGVMITKILAFVIESFL